MRGDIWTFPRLDGYEPIESYRKLPTIRSKSRWQMRRLIGQYIVSLLNNSCIQYELRKRDPVFIKRGDIQFSYELVIYKRGNIGNTFKSLGHFRSQKYAKKAYYNTIKKIKEGYYDKQKETKKENK